MKYLILVFFIIVIVSCNMLDREKELEEINKKEILASFEGGNIFAKELDSISSKQIYDLKLAILESSLDQKILMLEAKKHNIGIKELILQEIGKMSNPSGIDLIETKNDQLIKYRNYIDSLKSVYKVEIFLRPNTFKEINPANLYSINFSGKDHKKVLYIISSFECGACKKSSEKIINIVKKYSGKIEFRFIPFSEYLGIMDIGIIAASNQDQAFNFYKFVSKKQEYYSDTNLMYEFVANSNIDGETFLNEIENKTDLLKLIKNKETLISKGIYSTPAFIVNNKILDDKYSVNYLEDVIIDEFFNN